jgi:ABC-2 type transport system ATP-binding protein
MVEVSRLTKFYGEARAIADVSFVAPRGRIVGLLGPNGAGKTTTIRIITGFLPPTSGTVRVAGYDVARDSLEARRRIGYLPENPPLYPDMRVRAYLQFMARLRGLRKKDAAGAVDRVLERCGLQEVAGRLIRQLSRGYRQRVGLAQALVHDPPVLVLDEPTIGLDPRQIVEIRGLIQSLAPERTVILSTHILPEVSQLCHKVVIIHEGRVVVEQELDELTRGATLEEVFMRSIAQEPPASFAEAS